MIDQDKAWSILNSAEELSNAAEIHSALVELARAIAEVLSKELPVVLSVMGGAIIFTGLLLPLLRFPLEFDYIHATRYNEDTTGKSLKWIVEPKKNLRDRSVLVLDDILDEGHTMAAIREKVMACGAKCFYSAVLIDKRIGKPKPISADFVGLSMPNRYLFGVGMDVHGFWRNLPSIYALMEDKS